jgi:glutamate synthase (NADPH/NADH) small chain
MTTGYTYSQAMAEAARCLLCHEPPCSAGCPANTDPGKFIRQLRLLNLKGAIATMYSNNVLAASCGVLCPTCSLCASGCTAEGLDEPIDIGGLQRFLAEYAWEIGFSPLAAGEPNGIAVAVVGSGPAGLACAAELARQGFGVTVFEKLDQPGGVLRHVLPEHRLTAEYYGREVDAVAKLGVEFRCNQAIETREAIQGLFDQGFAAVYLATGAWEGVRLGIPGSDAEGIQGAMPFLALCKKEPEKARALVAGKEIAVIGGGDTAMDVAVSAKNLGAKDVYVLYRRSFQQMPGDRDEKVEVLHEGIHFVMLVAPTSYRVDGGKVTGIELLRNRLGAPDGSGRRRPEPIPGTEHTFAADLVVEAIGLQPGKSLSSLAGLRIDPAGRIQVSDAGETGIPNVFAGGDAVRGAALISHAIGDGHSAAVAIANTLLGGN